MNSFSLIKHGRQPRFGRERLGVCLCGHGMSEIPRNQMFCFDFRIVDSQFLFSNYRMNYQMLFAFESNSSEIENRFPFKINESP